MTTFCFRRFERFNMTEKLLKAHLRTRYNLSQNLASMWLAQHDCLQIKTISISSEKFILWLFHCLNNWIVSCFNHSKIWQAFILLLSYCILLQREYFMESKEFTHKLLMYQKSHSFAPLTRSISDTKTTSAGILYKALHSTASYPCHNPRPYSTYHNIPNFTQGTYPWSSPPPFHQNLLFVLKYVTSRSVTWSQPSDQDGRRNDMILQLIWSFLEERQWLRYISWQNRDKIYPRK